MWNYYDRKRGISKNVLEKLERSQTKFVPDDKLLAVDWFDNVYAFSMIHDTGNM